jgi:DNA modification methylase
LQHGLRNLAAIADPVGTSMPKIDSHPLDGHQSPSPPKQTGPVIANENPSLDHQLDQLLDAMEALAADIPISDRTADLGSLVTSAEMRNERVHRWFSYKEGFSPRLPIVLVNELGSGLTKTVADPFVGVGTTLLALRRHPEVKRAIGIEYSPLAHFVAQTKLQSLNLDPASLNAHIDRLTPLPTSGPVGKVPRLASFQNVQVFNRTRLYNLLRARLHIQSDQALADTERAFFLLGIAAVIEDLSNVMKDGRALRLLKGRVRKKQGIRPEIGYLEENSVEAAIVNQWRAMVQDLESLQSTSDDLESRPSATEETHVQVIRGDACTLTQLVDETNDRVIQDNSIGLYIYSPPYLNFIDYTEVYKLELWFLGFVTDEQGFRRVREGTLRSHPSIDFPSRSALPNGAKVFNVIDSMTEFLISNLSRPSIGKIPGYYFGDMYQAIRTQFATLEPGGAIACVVANSTFSRRHTIMGSRVEAWRLPILTDVIIARMAEAVGFVDIEIWKVRSLQAKNVSAGFAREAVVVARKPPR